MKTLFLKNIKKTLKEKKKFEAKLGVKIAGGGRNLTVEGGEVEEYLACLILEAVELGFSVEKSLLLTEPDYILEKIDIKNYTKRQNLAQIRARIIGRKGETKELIEELSDCHMALTNNTVGVIGRVENIKNCINAVVKLIRGSKQASVYAYLERQRRIYHPEDLGLKDKF